MAFSGYRSIKGLELFPAVGTQNPARVFVRGADTRTRAGQLALRYAAAHAQDFYVRTATQFSLSIVEFTKFSTALPDGDRVVVTFNGPDTTVQIDVAPRVTIPVAIDTPVDKAVYVVKPKRPDGSIPFGFSFVWFLQYEGSARSAKLVSTGVPPKDFNYLFGTHGGVIGRNGRDAISWNFTEEIYSKGRQIGSVAEAIGDPDDPDNPYNTERIIGGLISNGRALIVVSRTDFHMFSFDLDPEPGVLNQNLRIELFGNLEEWAEEVLPRATGEGNYQFDSYRGISISPDRRRLIVVLHSRVVDVLAALPEDVETIEDVFSIDATLLQPQNGNRITTFTRSGTEQTGSEGAEGEAWTWKGTVSSVTPAFAVSQYAYPEWVYPEEEDEPVGHDFNWVMLDITDSGYSYSGAIDEGYNKPEGFAVWFGGASTEGYDRVAEVYLRFPDGEELLVARRTEHAEAHTYTRNEVGQQIFTSGGEADSDWYTEYIAGMGAGLAHGHRRVYTENTDTIVKSLTTKGQEIPTQKLDVNGNLIEGVPSITFETFEVGVEWPHFSQQLYNTNRYADQAELGRSLIHSHQTSGIEGITSSTTNTSGTVFTGALDALGAPVDIISTMQAGATEEYPDPGFADLPDGWFFLYIAPW